jgi:hypothetical protein
MHGRFLSMFIPISIDQGLATPISFFELELPLAQSSFPEIMATTTNDRGHPAAENPTYRRQGGAWQLSIESLSDLRHALDLDAALWVANSAPLSTFAADATFLRCLDQDGDGRIRVDSVREALNWLLDHLAPEPQGRRGESTLNIAAILSTGPDSEKLLTATRKLVRRFGDLDSPTISLGQVRQVIGEVERGGLDRPGVVRPEAAGDHEVKGLIESVLAALNSCEAKPIFLGITRDQLERFMAEAKRFLDWLDEPELSGEPNRTRIMPLGAATTAAYDLFAKLAPRIDQFFALCDALHFTVAAPNHPGNATRGSPEIDWNNPEALEALVRNAPVAWWTTKRKLDLAGALNPHWREALEQLRREVLEPLLNMPVTELAPEQWQRIKQMLAPHGEWRSQQPVSLVNCIPAERLRHYLANDALVSRLRDLIADSHSTAFDLNNLRLLEKLILFQANLLRLANSFINFSDLYHPDRRALFEMGTLIMDGRRFTFSVKVADRALHARFSNTSNMFVIYAEITGENGAKLYDVALPVTAGTKGMLQVDKWGAFLDREGRTLNARIVQIVENPISFREAIAAPFKRLGRALMIRFGERSAEEEKRLESITAQTLERGRPAAAHTDRRTALPFLANPGGVLAGGGIAIAALGSSLAFITRTLAELEWTTILAGVAGAAAAVILPVTAVAVIKLAGRDLSCMLEGSGWGVNARMALTHTLARTFTRRPRPVFVRQKRRGQLRLLLLLLLLAIAAGAAGLLLWRA